MALGGFFGGATVVIDELSGTRHSPGVFAVFPTYGSLKKYIMESFDIHYVVSLFDNGGRLRYDGDPFDSPPFVVLNVGGGVWKRFILTY